MKTREFHHADIVPGLRRRIEAVALGAASGTNSASLRRALLGVILVSCVAPLLNFLPVPSEFQSSAGLLGYPLVAWGQSPVAWISLGACPIGLIAVGGTPIGVISLGGLSIGMIALGGLSVGCPLSMGGCALGYYSFGGCSLGVFSYAGSGFSRGLLVAQGRQSERLWGDPE